ncbi:hypothetical protein [Streptomyces rubellomurinus]|uniref:Uncharacterized protein n=1 Tax=Streptomyces rubellomurinus (strain ATCC 31215) TaxID=359131 RepID=A0A0F2TCM3_STRR3|nr:hypothetical protein [Streptomyces rubellomurinus]KJS60070.1 hypothetical protein VM95_23515 [Streptomyces rubellomurinus]
MSSTEPAARELQERAALWTIGEVRAHEVVDAACDALVAGLGGPALWTLAACTRGEADCDVPEILPAALDELGLTFHPVGSEACREAAVRALANRTLAGRLTPRELASRIHLHFGHRLPLAERLAELDDEYDLVHLGAGRAAAEVDAEVRAEALRLARDAPAHSSGR